MAQGFFARHVAFLPQRHNNYIAFNKIVKITVVLLCYWQLKSIFYIDIGGDATHLLFNPFNSCVPYASLAHTRLHVANNSTKVPTRHAKLFLLHIWVLPVIEAAELSPVSILAF